uniref:Uncharacterized protein n=1 Tax=Amphimedon queenslandica TaxID=400682 RepID=A0A1X7SV26_AMPQE
MLLRRIRALAEQVAAPPRAPMQVTAGRAATSPAVIVAGGILWYKRDPPPDVHCQFLVQSEQETSYCYRKCEMVSAK